jgi:hypothetical protein
MRNNSMFEMGCKFNVFVIFEELLDAAMWLILPMGCWAWYQKTSLLYL